MRTIYVNSDIARVEDGCGFRPLRKCPLQVYARQHLYAINCDRSIPWKTKLIFGPVDNIAKVCADIQEICDICSFGSAFKIRQKQH